MEESRKPFENFELIDCGGFYMTGVTNDAEIEAAAMLLATQNDEAKKFLTGYPTTIQEANKKILQCIASFFERQALTFIIKVEGLGPIGFIHVYVPDTNTELNDWIIEYYLNKDFWSQGIMTVAVQTVLAFLQENDVPNVKAVVDQDNVASKRLLQKFGFTFFARNSKGQEVYTRSLRRPKE